MKIKVSEAEGIALDWLVAKAEGLTPTLHKNPYGYWVLPNIPGSYSTDWSKGGPIIEREWLDVTPWPNESDENLRWQCTQHDSKGCVCYGPTPLIAAMRCYVVSKLGDEVEVPEELLV